jgi:hypothetical protein
VGLVSVGLNLACLVSFQPLRRLTTLGTAAGVAHSTRPLLPCPPPRGIRLANTCLLLLLLCRCCCCC